MGDDAALLAVVTSANVACGRHAGDATTMLGTCQAAVARGVAIGAHVSYADREGFGRRAVEIEPRALAGLVAEQVLALEAHASAAGGAVAYVKPHGALYNRIVAEAEQAGGVVDGVRDASRTLDRPLGILGLPGSAVLRLAAAAGVDGVPEAFADRAYAADGTLVPRSLPGAVISDPGQVVARSLAIARGEPISAAGAELVIEARSLCVHGDTPGAAALAARVRERLEANGVDVRAFVSTP